MGWRATWGRMPVAPACQTRVKPVRINLGLGFRDFLRNSSTDGITSLLEPKRSIRRSKMVQDRDLIASLS